MTPLPLSQLAQETVNAEWDSLLLSMDYWDNFVHWQEMPAHIQALVRDARHFSYQYKDFFASIPPEQLMHDATDEWTVLHQAHECLLNEWDTIRHALEQRTNERCIPTLKALDQLAAESLQTLFPDVAGSTITYLHKLYDVTRFAFSSQPIIGAPFSALHLPESWLSIPHEAGHYIFWNSTTTMGEFAQFYATLEQAVIGALAETLGQRQGREHFRHTGEIYRSWLVWLNEIFADIYGTLIAGPAIGWSMQSLLRSCLNRRDLYHIHGDPDHPDPYVRPFIHISTLRNMAKLSPISEFAEQLWIAADDLASSWRESWADDPVATLFTPDNWGSMTELLDYDLPAVVSALMEVKLANLDGSLADYFVNGGFYTPERHERIMAAVTQLVKGEEVERIESKLEMSVIVQLAIVYGAEPDLVRSNFGFDLKLQQPEPDDKREEMFREFLNNATGYTERTDQQLAWRKVLSATASEVVRHTHTHVHKH